MATDTRAPVLAWSLAALAAVVVALALRESFLGMAFQWRSSSTFSYGVLILPIALFLLWRERGRLAAIRPEAGWLALALMVPVGASWVLGMLLDVNVVQHFAAVLLVILAVWAVLGTPAAKVIWFPLAYLLLMVPFGEFLVPVLMQWTADFAVLAVALSGVPVYQDGYVFSLPSGDFEVIKACSGIRFLMATVAAGTVFAWVAYRSWRKRLLFLLACFVVPVIGNLARAYFVVMLVHLSDGRLAGAHILYGTIFFGAILLGLFFIGARFADHPDPAGRGEARGTAVADRTMLIVPAAAASIVAILLALLPGTFKTLRADAASSALPAIDAPLRGYALRVDTTVDWRPDLRGSPGEQQVSYQSAARGRPVDAYVASYDTPAAEGELTDSRNQLFDGHAWRRVGGRSGGGYTEAVLRPAPDSSVAEGAARVVWSWYVVNGQATDSALAAKWLELRGLLGGGQFIQVLVALSAPFEDQAANARQDLRVFAPDFCAGTGLPCPPSLGPGALSPDLRQPD